MTMLKEKRFIIIFILMNVLILFGWDLIFRGNLWLMNLDILILQTTAMLFGLIQFRKAYKKTDNRQKTFWLILSIGTALCLVGNILWLVPQVIKGEFVSTSIEYLFWLLGRITYLIALFYRIRGIDTIKFERVYIFNIMIFMITTASLTLYYLIEPTLNYAEHSLASIIVALTYPIVNSSIVLMVFVLCYLVYRRVESPIMLFLTGGFLLTVIGDSYYAFLEASGNFYFGGTVDYLWLIGMIIFRQLLIIKENNSLIREFSYLAYHDPLTGLSNRTEFKETLEVEMKRVQDKEVVLLLIDLDRFKVANDTLGHQVGDEILVKAAERIEEVLEPDMKVFRLGGDEFAVIILQELDSKCNVIAEKILQNIQKPFKINDYEISLTASIGISIFPKTGRSYEELFKFADTAMYLAKDSGKNGFKYYDDNLNEVMGRRLKIESDLRKGLETNQFELYYQPKVTLISREITGVEALLRWNHPELGWISPVEFIPIAEETGQVMAIGEWVLRNACKQNQVWQEKGLSSIRMSVNVSVKQFQHGALVRIVKKALEESGLSPRYLEIEVTESIMQNTSESSEVLHQFREMGIQISIDDFGTGYSSLNIIQQLPIDTIKLDRSFITDIENENQLSMVKTIINLGENLKLNVVAEGIETEYQLTKLIESGCQIGQGFLFSKPVEPDQFELLLRQRVFPNRQ